MWDCQRSSCNQVRHVDFLNGICDNLMPYRHILKCQWQYPCFSKFVSYRKPEHFTLISFDGMWDCQRSSCNQVRHVDFLNGICDNLMPYRHILKCQWQYPCFSKFVSYRKPEHFTLIVSVNEFYVFTQNYQLKQVHVPTKRAYIV